MLDNIDSISTKQTVLGGDLNFQFELLLETKLPVAMIILSKEAFDICDIWRIRNRKFMTHISTKSC